MARHPKPTGLLCTATFMLLIGTTTNAWAGESKVFPYCQPPICSPLWKQRCECPDDYVVKCLPPVPCYPCTVCDDYCRKLLPCPPKPFCCFDCDHYCPKKGPIRFETCTPCWYRCAETPTCEKR